MDRIIQGRNITIDPSTASVTRDGQTLHLTMSEYRVLLALISNRGQALTIDELKGLWRGYADENNIRELIHRLRRKVEPDPRAPQYVITVPGGYMMPRD